MTSIEKLKIKIYADGADLDSIVSLSTNSIISGFTTNPSLMRKAGVENYKEFSKSVLSKIGKKSLSLEVFADDFSEMLNQARTIASWGDNIAIKIPIMTTKGVFTGPVIETLCDEGVFLNVTAIMTVEQVEKVVSVARGKSHLICSVFAGRIADTGIDPVMHMQECLKLTRDRENTELLWASPREVFNIFQANEIGCEIITVGHDLLKKIELVGKDLNEYSRETVQMFYTDAKNSRFEIN
jgi:transaldolase